MRVVALLSLALAVLAQEPIRTSSRHARLHHRFVPAVNGEDGQWTYRGDVTYDIATLKGDFKEGSNVQLLDDKYLGTGQSWYQVGIETGDGEWAIASTRACFVASPRTMTINLFLEDETPHGLTIHMKNAPASGECPPDSLKRSMVLPHRMDGARVVVNVQEPTKVYPPGLAPPPPVDASTGQPAAPVEEKSFLAKYWLPLLGIGIFLIGQFGPEPPKEGKK